MSGKHGRPLPMSEMTPAEKGTEFDRLEKESMKAAENDPKNIVDQWNESVKRRDGK